MTLYAGISPRHVNSYHNNNSLLFQFILAEFIESYSQIQNINSLISRMPVPLPSEEQSASPMEYNLQLVNTVLTTLVGPTINYMRLFSWNFNEGLLSKLRTYCSLFLQSAEMEGKEPIAIQHNADKMWQGCIQALDLLHETPLDRAAFAAALNKSNAAMQRFAKLITRLIHQFKNDENVIFFVLRNHKILDKLYGPRYTVKLFSQLYSKGLKEGLIFLAERYTERRFQNVLPMIRAAADEIENSSS